MSQPGATTTPAGTQPPASTEVVNPTPPATTTPPNAPGGTAANDDQAFDGDENQWDEKTRAYIKRLRQESAKHRTKAKSASGEQTVANKEAEALKSGIKKLLGLEADVSPEEQVQMLDSKVQQSEFNSSILELALEHGIPKDKVKYLKFLVAEAVGQLEEGQEMEDEALEAIIKDVKGSGGGQPQQSSTSIPTVPGQTPAPGQTGETTLEAFAKMNMGERSLLHSKNPALYQRLFEEAKLKKLL